MARKTIYGTCYDYSGAVTPKYLFYAECTAGTPSVSGNYTPFTVSVMVRRNPDYAYADSAYNLYNSVKFSLSVDDSVLFSTSTANIDTQNGQIWTFTTKSKNVSHNDDGSKTVPIVASFSGVDVSSLDRGTIYGSMVLDTIPRASTITSADAVTLGNKCSVKWTPAAASFRYKLNFSIGDWSYTTDAIHPNQTSAYTYTGYTIPLEVANQLKNAKTGKMTVTLYTYSNSGATTQVGSADSETFTVTVPNNSDTQPAITMALSPVSSLAEAFAGLYIQGKTKVKAVLSAEGKYGASISSYGMAVEGSSYGSGDGYTSAFLSQYGTSTVTGSATDSRGYTGSITEDITVIAYSKPKILPVTGENDVVAARCDANGDLSDSGTYLKIRAKRSYSKVMSGDVQKNFCKIQYRYKAESASSWSAWETILAGDDLASDEVTTDALLGGVLAVETTYMVQVQAVDDIGESAFTTATIPTEKVFMHRDGKRRSLTFGGYVEEDDCFAIAEDITTQLRGNVSGKVYGLGKLPAIPQNSDFNTYFNFGRFAVTSNADANTMANCPCTSAGVLMVSSGNGDGKNNGAWRYIIQEYKAIDGGFYTRTGETDENGDLVWDTWLEGNGPKVLPVDRGGTDATTPAEACKNLGLGGKILWSGGWYMTAGHIVTLSEKVSVQPNGIILVFSQYYNGGTMDADFFSFFIPKKIVELFPGKGHTFLLGTANFGRMATKHLLISDDKVSGTDYNGNSGTYSGITFDNLAFVLRYVIGV